MSPVSSLLTLLQETPVSWLIGACAFGYLLGSIPFGLLLTRAAGLGDVRAIGSGNIGATNVLRTGHKGLAAATLALDAAKGAAAVLLAAYFFGDAPALLAGFFAFLGHVFPAWLGFRGGKGVATFLGVLLASAWPSAAAFGAIWLVVAIITRISSLSALIATAVAPFAAWASGYPEFSIVAGAMSVIVLIKHHANIRRLVAGEEPKIGAKA